MILIRPRAIVVVALSMLIFTATVSVLSGLRSAPGAFAAGEGFVISDNDAPTIFSSRVGVDLVLALGSVQGITGASPEVFAFSSYDGESFVVRGVGLDGLNDTGPAFENFWLAEGLSMSSADSALVGDRLLERLGVELPFTLPLVGSYSSKMTFVNAVGSYSTSTSLDDELLVSLDTARFLSGMPKDKVSVIRVATDDPEWLAGVLSPASARFTLFDLHTSKAEVALGEPQSISVGVRNWGGEAGATVVKLTEGGLRIDEIVVPLGPSESTRVTANVTTDSLGERNIVVSIDGDFPVTLHANFTVIEPYLKLSAPSKVLLGSVFNVSVTKSCGDPAEGAVVTFGTQSATVGSSGTVSLTATVVGTWTAHATMPGMTESSVSVEVQDPSAFPSEFLPSVVDFAVLPEIVKESEPAKGVLSVTNGGSLGGQFAIDILVDSQVHLTLDMSLAGMSSATIRFEISGVAPGTHVVQAGSFSRPLTVEPWIAENPGLVELVLKYGGTAALSPSASIPIYQAAKISEGNVSVALLAIGAVSALLAALAITSIYSKEVHESRHTLGVLRTIGASGREVRRLVFPQALGSGLAGSAIGVIAGVFLAHVISRYGLFMVFGHELVLGLDLQLLLTVLLSSVAIGAGTALWCSITASRETAIASVRGLEDDGLPSPAETPEDR